MSDVQLIDGRPGQAMTTQIEVGEVLGEYRKKPSATVRVARLTREARVLTPHGEMIGHEGDLLVINLGNGEAWPVDPEYFDANYEPVPAA